MKSPRSTGIVLGFLLLVYLFSFFHYSKWNDFILNGGDSWGYYAYLPALFIHNDLDNLESTLEANVFHEPNRLSSPDNPFGIYEANPAENGNPVIKYTVGVSILQLPFFAIAHLVAAVTPYKADGFSPPYMLLVHLSSLLYVFLGLIFLSKVLKQTFDDRVTATVILIVGLATNLYYFTVYNTGMAHSYLFFLYCLLLYATQKWYSTKLVRHAVMVGLTCGLITLIRPAEIICILIPLSFGITGIKSLKERFSSFVDQYKGYLAAVAIFILSGIPQLIYWKVITGDFLYYSYGNESLDLTNPKILKGMFYYSNGWLNYTPIMALGLLGIFFLYRHKKYLLPIVLFISLHIYIIYSWHNPNYVNGFGSRPMVETYAVFALPLAALVGMTFKWLIPRVFLLCIVIFFTCLNVFQTWQCANGILWTEDAKRAYYWESFGKTKWTYEALIANDINVRYPDTSKLKYVKDIYYEDFESSQPVLEDSTSVFSGKNSFHLKPEMKKTTENKISLDNIDLKEGDWLKVSGQFRSELPIRSRIHCTYFAASFARQDGSYRKNYNLRVENKLGDPTFSPFWGTRKTWDHLHFFIPVTKKINPQTDDLLIYLLNQFERELLVDELKVEHWTRR